MSRAVVSELGVGIRKAEQWDNQRGLVFSASSSASLVAFSLLI